MKESFAKKTSMPHQPIDVKKLKRCSKGLSKHMHKEKDPVKRKQFSDIKDEIDWLIEQL